MSNNILITYLSVLPNSNSLIEYDIDGTDSVTALYTNEVAIRYFKKCDTKINQIIAVCSNAVMESPCKYMNNITAYQYFEGVLNECFPDTELITVESDEPGDISGIFDAINEHIARNSEIYLDMTGGYRDAVYSLALIARFLEYRGITVKKVVYSLKGKDRGTIKDFTENFRLMSLINSVSEFVNFGNSESIDEFYKDSNNPMIRDLISEMRDFSNIITLGKVANVKEYLDSLRRRIDKCETGLNPQKIDERMFLEMLPVIKQKFFGESESADYISIIKWCLNNNLLQQALTLYTEKIPEIVLKNRLIEPLFDIYNAKYGTLAGDNIYAAVFYSNFLDMDMSPTTKFKNRAIAAAKKGTGISKSFLKDKDFGNAFMRYRNIYTKIASYGPFQSLARARAAKEMADRSWDEETKKAWELLMLKDNNTELYNVTNNTFYNLLLGIDLDSKVNTLQKKIVFLENFERCMGFKTSSYKINIALKDIRRISVSYVFFKAVRNEINHASQKENLDAEQQKFFSDEGLIYKMEVSILKEQLIRELNFVKKVIDRNGN